MNVLFSGLASVTAIIALWVAWGFYGEFMTMTSWNRKAFVWAGTITALLFTAWVLAGLAVQQLAVFVG